MNRPLNETELAEYMDMSAHRKTFTLRAARGDESAQDKLKRWRELHERYAARFPDAPPVYARHAAKQWAANIRKGVRASYDAYTANQRATREREAERAHGTSNTRGEVDGTP